MLEPGQIFGEEDLIEKNDYRASLVCAQQNSELFIMNREDF